MSRNFELLSQTSPGRDPLPMLRRDKEEIRPQPLQRPGHSDQASDWRRWFRALQNHWRWSVAFAVLVAASVTAVVLLKEPVYEPVARIEVDPPGKELFSLQNRDVSDSTLYVGTQVKNLESDQLALAVIRNLGLDRNRKFVGIGDAELQHVAASSSGNSSGSEISPSEMRALRVFRPSLHVQRDTSSWLLDVSFAANDPKLAALVTNSLVEQFMDFNYRTRHDAIANSTKWLTRQLDDIRERMQGSNVALANLQKNSGITPVGESGSTFEERVAELTRQLTLAQAERIQLDALLARVKSGATDNLPQVSADPAVQELSRKWNAARADLAEALVVFGKNHPKVKQLQAQVDQLGTELTTQENRVVANLNTSYAAAHRRETLLNSELKSTSKELDQLAQYQSLKKEAQANADLYNSLYAKVKEAAIAEEVKTENIRWVDRAPVLDRPTRPKRMLDIAAGLLAGLLGGVFLALILEILDDRVRSVDDLRQSTGLASVYIIPKMVEGNRTRFLSWRLHSLESEPNIRPPLPVLLGSPQSVQAEALRGLFTAVHLARSSASRQVLLVASAVAAEGKTTVAANLAILLARSHKTCLVDADLRKPGVARLFGVNDQPGLAQVLSGSCSLEAALVPAPEIRNLVLLPAGSVECEPGELVIDSIANVLHNLRQQFAHVVVDSTPILPYAEGRIIASMSDGIIFVGRSGESRRNAIARSLELLDEVHSAPVLTMVLNGVSHNSADYDYKYGYGAPI